MVDLPIGKPVLMHGLTGAQAPGPDDVGGPTQGSRKKKKKGGKKSCTLLRLPSVYSCDRERGRGERAGRLMYRINLSHCDWLMIMAVNL